MVARSVDGRRLLVGEAKWLSRPAPAASLRFRPSAPPVPGAGDLEIVRVVFTPEAPAPAAEPAGATRLHVVDGRTVFSVLR